LPKKTEDKLQQLLKKHDLTEKDLENILKSSKGEATGPERYQSHQVPYNHKRLKFGVISDLHIGHKNYQPQILEHAAKYLKRQGAEFVLMPGDILEGMSGRDGHVYELEQLGASQQMEYGVQQLNQLEMPIYAITASNSHDGWFSSKKNMGFEVGPELERRLENFTFLGYDEADLELDNGLKLRMRHPGDGTAYAESYKLQKYINSITGGDKPNFLAQGHYHKALYMLYRNIHAIESGSLQSQTIFMKKKNTPSVTGYWSIDLAGDEKGISRLKPEFVAFYA
jgi:predicted phosphodiesterase